jgi:ferredoxin
VCAEDSRRETALGSHEEPDLEATTTVGRTGRRLRLISRCAALLATAVLLLPQVPWRWLAAIPTAVSPLVAISSAAALHAVSALTLAALPVLLLILSRRRWFCRWACPTGLLTECAGQVGASLGLARRAGVRWPLLGPWIAWLTLAGACLGYPLLVWLDPLAILTGCLGAASQPGTWWGWCYALGLPAVLLLSLFQPGLWCRKLCPLGATQDLVTLPQVRLQSPVWRKKREDEVPVEPTRTELGRTRRSLLAAAVGVAWAAVTLRFARTGEARPIRPPAAIGEREFPGVCIRCGNCVRACPTRIIRPDLGAHGVASFLSPVVQFEEGYCQEDCCRCSAVCPSGAIARLSLEQKPHVAMGLPRVDMAICLLGDDRECAACRNHCPYAAITYVFNEADYTTTPQIDPAKCNGCGACQVYCPTTPAKAIVVRPA